MINFEKELKNFQPSLEVEEAEAAIYNHDLTRILLPKYCVMYVRMASS